jgi:phosphoribosylaminoimidazole carboxylase (NCAIR synthetase)
MKLMVLGGGSCQLNLITRAKALGHTVVVADYLPNCPGSQAADLHLPISTFDIAGVTQAAAEHHVDAIVTLGTDQPVLTAASVSETLGLPFYINTALATAVTNKRVMKKIFTDNGIPTADYRLIGEGFADSDIAGLAFPAVLKPVDSQGQRGIFLVNDITDVRARICETLSFSREDKALLEAYYENDEITVNGWACGGHMTLISVVDRVTIRRDSHIGICLCHNFPSIHLDANFAVIEDLTRRIVSAFGITDGPLYFQYLVGADGIKVNEIAMRIGGAYEDITIPIISGIDVLSFLLNTVQNRCCDQDILAGYDLKSHNAFVSTQLFFCRPGTIKSITPKENILALPFVYDIGYNYVPGDVIPQTENATARAGYMIVEGSSFPDMIKNVGRAFDALQIRDDADENLVIPYSEYEDKYLFMDARAPHEF